MPHNTTYDAGLNNIYCANLERYAGNNLFLHISTSLHLILKVDDAHILNSTRFLWKSYSFLLRLSEADKFGALSTNLFWSKQHAQILKVSRQRCFISENISMNLYLETK